MANTFGTQNSVSFALRHKYFSSNLAYALRNVLVAEKICNVDRSDLKTVENPFLTQPTATIQAVAGTYSVSATTTTEDTLSVADEVVASTHVFNFEMATANFNLVTDFLDDLMYVVGQKIDQFVLNKILSQATGTYTTPAGGFTTASNLPVIMANLLSKIGGYEAGVASKPFLVVENTDLVGILQTQVASGFSYADSALRNGFIGEYMNVPIYVIRTGTFTTATLGTLSATNSGHRLFGISNLATYASPRGVQYEEKPVTGKTGREIVAYGLIGAKVWTPQAGLFINITLA